MILDSLTNAEMYYHLHPLFKEAFEYIKKIDFASADIGKTILRENELFLMVSDSDLKSKSHARLEAHNSYIDIQLPISKQESFGWKSREKLSVPDGEFNEDKDIQFFDDEPSSYLSLSPGDFVLFFPGDGHAPCIGEGTIRKVVVKIKI